VQIGTGEKNSLSSEFEEESKERDLHRVVEHPADSARGCLSRRIARRASHSPEGGERRRNCFLRSLGEKRSSGWIALYVRRDPVGAQELKNPSRVRR
jgi:hypothetical protein